MVLSTLETAPSSPGTSFALPFQSKKKESRWSSATPKFGLSKEMNTYLPSRSSVVQVPLVELGYKNPEEQQM